MILQTQAASPDSLGAALAAIDWIAILRPDELLRKLAASAVVVVLAIIAYRVVRLLTRRLEREIRAEDPLVKRLREQRARTLASLLNNVALVTIVALAGLTILASFINIGPFLAGIGVLGLAVSFGAQSVVKDVISGAFILAEGQFGIGDVIRVGDTAGSVEKITLRATVLRDLHGTVHVIPNGEITRVSNLTKTWSRAVLDIGVPYGEDVDRVIALLGELSREITKDPEWAALLTEPPQVLGIEDFDAASVTVRMIATTLPLKQWDVARELRRRIRKRFDAEGIAPPFPRMTVDWGDGRTTPALPAPGTAPAAPAEPATEAGRAAGPPRD